MQSGRSIWRRLVRYAPWIFQTIKWYFIAYYVTFMRVDTVLLEFNQIQSKIQFILEVESNSNELLRADCNKEK